MANVFLLYIPPGNHEAMVHYEDTIRHQVLLSRINPLVSPAVRSRLAEIFGARSKVAVWGSRAGPRNRSNFERMSAGDDILIIEGESIRLIGKIAAKVESDDLSRELWQPLRGRGDVPWSLIYFIANPRELSVPLKEFRRLFGYSREFRLRGFTAVAPGRLEDFYTKYDDLYSVLVRVQEGQPVQEKTLAAAEPPAAPPGDRTELTTEVVDDVLTEKKLSDHARMQWKLARLGIKAGERVWVPVGDQERLRTAFEFDSFDKEFAAGLDLPHSYLENIDVVWKQEFRIGAAYEIENSTSIYSGLLRFADLNIVAPNTLYPMFVVAPKHRKNQLREQLRRPAFKRLELQSKVRFLPYEIVDEIDQFFTEASGGLNIDVILNRSETVL